jgi:hypothetical protein
MLQDDNAQKISNRCCESWPAPCFDSLVEAKNERAKSGALLAVCAALFALFSPATGQAQEERIIGIVKSVTGEWRQSAYPGKRLSVGSPVLAGAIVRAGASNAQGNEITISLIDDREIARVCSAKGKCGTPMTMALAVKKPPAPVKAVQDSAPVLATAPQQSSLVARVTGALKRYLSNTSAYVPLIAREGGIRIQEDVVEIASKQINLSEVLRGTPAGRYYLTLSNIKGADSAAALSDYLYAWNPAHPAPVESAALKPGLYNLAVRAMKNGPPVEAWILISEPKQYRADKQSLEEIRNITNAWDANLFTQSRAVLRAYMDELSERSSPSR